MEKFFELVARFQALKNRTGTHKSSAYELSVQFSPWSEDVSLNWGAYDVGSYPRHYMTTSTRAELLAHMEAEIVKMEAVVTRDEQQADRSESNLM